jgi:hypothetical protein
MTTDAQGENVHVDDGAPAMSSRRRMLRRSVGTAAPVIATLVSGPVSAGSCLVASGFTSSATFTSRHPLGVNNCAGISPAGWISLGAVGNATSKFNAIFASGNSYKLDGNPTLLEVLQGTDPLARDVAAAWLNAKKPVTGYVITAAQAVTIWQTFGSGATYTPAGVTVAWTVDQTKKWIEMSWAA